MERVSASVVRTSCVWITSWSFSASRRVLRKETTPLMIKTAMARMNPSVATFPIAGRMLPPLPGLVFEDEWGDLRNRLFIWSNHWKTTCGHGRHAGSGMNLPLPPLFGEKRHGETVYSVRERAPRELS